MRIVQAFIRSNQFEVAICPFLAALERITQRIIIPIQFREQTAEDENEYLHTGCRSSGT
jgi:hypothetical protein